MSNFTLRCCVSVALGYPENKSNSQSKAGSPVTGNEQTMLREGGGRRLVMPTCKQLQGHEISHLLLASSSSISCPYFFSTISSPCSIIWLKEQLQNRNRQILVELVWEKLAYCWSLRNFLKDSKLSHKSPLSLWQIGGSRWQAGI